MPVALKAAPRDGRKGEMTPEVAAVSEMYTVRREGARAMPFGWPRLASTMLTAPVAGLKR